MKFSPKNLNNYQKNNFISKNINPNVSKPIIGKNNKKENKEKTNESKKQIKSNTKTNNKKKNITPTWKKLEFPISQFSGKIKNNYKNYPKYLDKEDIDIILKLISKESRNFSPVKIYTKIIFIFIILCLSTFILGILFLFQKKTYLGLILILICFILCFIYMHRIRKSINNKYKKCHRDLFYLTDYINRKYLGDLGYYLLVDFNFKFIGIYIIPNYIRQVLKFRDKNIELKKKLEGETINHLHKKEDINKFDKSNYYINNTFYNNNIKTIFNSHINYFTFDYNINNKFNKNINMDNPNFKNDIGNDYNISNNTNNNQIKYNNFFNNVEENNNNNNIKIGDIIIDVPLNKKKINKTINSEINNRSIDKFKDYIENKYNGLGILNDKN